MLQFLRSQHKITFIGGLLAAVLAYGTGFGGNHPPAGVSDPNDDYQQPNEKGIPKGLLPGLSPEDQERYSTKGAAAVREVTFAPWANRLHPSNLLELLPPMVYLTRFSAPFSEKGINPVVIETLGTLPFLKDLNLAGALKHPSYVMHFHHLKHLEGLDLRFNQLGEIGFNDFLEKAHLGRLTHFFTQGNQWGPHQLERLKGKLPHLTHFEFSNSQLGPNDLKHFQAFPKLVYLDIHNNPQVTDHGLQHLMPLKESLNHLNMSNCDIGPGGAFQIINLTKLNALELGYNPLTEQGVQALNQFPHLKALDLPWIPDLRAAQILGQLSSLPKFPEQLSVLRLDSDSLQGVGPHLLKFKNLKHLYLTGKDLSTDDAMCLVNLTKLEKLQIASGGQLTRDIMENIAQLQGLKYLQLQGSQVNLEAARALTPLKNLEWVNFCGNPYMIDSQANTVAALFPKLRLMQAAQHGFWVNEPQADQALTWLPRTLHGLCHAPNPDADIQNILPQVQPTLSSYTYMAFGADLRSRIGDQEGTTRVVRQEKHAHLSPTDWAITYGPYLDLPAGVYESHLYYSSSNHPSQKMGYTDMCFKCGGVVFFKEDLFGTDGKVQHVSKVFEVSNPAAQNQWELRTWWNRVGELKVHHIAVSQVDPKFLS